MKEIIDFIRRKLSAVLFHDLLLLLRRMRHKLSGRAVDIMLRSKFRVSGRLRPVKARTAEIRKSTVFLQLNDLYVHLPEKAPHRILLFPAVL